MFNDKEQHSAIKTFSRWCFRHDCLPCDAACWILLFGSLCNLPYRAVLHRSPTAERPLNLDTFRTPLLLVFPRAKLSKIDFVSEHEHDEFTC